MKRCAITSAAPYPGRSLHCFLASWLLGSIFGIATNYFETNRHRAAAFFRTYVGLFHGLFNVQTWLGLDQYLFNTRRRADTHAN